MGNPPVDDTAPHDARPVKVFLCYRRADGSRFAKWLYTLLNGHLYRDASGTSCRVEVYFDQMTPGVADWIAHHLPSLQSARAFVVVSTHGLAKEFTGKDEEDWAYREIRWWVNNRKTVPPILIDTTGDARWIPEPIRDQWSNLNRLLVDPHTLAGDCPALDSEQAGALRDRILHTIAESEHATTFLDLQRYKKRAFQLAASLAFAVIALIAAGVSWRTAAQERERARAENRVSERTIGYLTSLFAWADPDKSFRNALTVQHVLAAGRPSIENEKVPRIKGSLLRAMGTVYTGLGESKTAIRMLEEAADILKTEHMDPDAQFRMEHALGEAYLYDEAQIEKARLPLEAAMALANSPNVDVQERSAALVSMGDYHTWSTMGDLQKAGSLYGQALAIDREANNDVGIARDLMRLGNLTRDPDDPQKQQQATEYFKAALETADRLDSDSKGVLTAQYMNDYASILYDEDKLGEALELYRRAYETFGSVYGEKSAESAIAANNIARVLIELDRVGDAAPLLEGAVEIQTTAFGKDFSPLAFSLNNLGLAQRAAGHIAESTHNFEEAARVAAANRIAIGAQSLVHRAELALAESDLEHAGEYLARAEDFFKSLEGTQGWRYALYQSAQGELETRRCNFELAKGFLDKSAPQLEERWPKGNLFTRQAEARERLYESRRKNPASCGAQATAAKPASASPRRHRPIRVGG